jgi:hypothetical protein
VIAEVFELAAMHDQLDLSNLVCMERRAGRAQFTEEGYRQKLENRRLEKTKKLADSHAERALLREARMAGGAIISHALIKHASERAVQENELLKQQHKALEARSLLEKK